MSSSGVWRRVDVDWTDVSEDRIASIFRVEKSASEEPAWAVTQKTTFFIEGFVSVRSYTQDMHVHLASKAQWFYMYQVLYDIKLCVLTTGCICGSYCDRRFGKYATLVEAISHRMQYNKIICIKYRSAFPFYDDNYQSSDWKVWNLAEISHIHIINSEWDIVHQLTVTNRVTIQNFELCPTNVTSMKTVCLPNTRVLPNRNIIIIIIIEIYNWKQ
jgi:hypothetical protein